MPIRSVVAMIPVRDMARSLAFYETLGFTVSSTFVPPGAASASWAWLDAQGGMLMLTAAKEPLAAGPRTVLYLYTDDVAEARAAFAAKGIVVGPLEQRFYAKKGEFRVDDPDGHVLMFTHL